MKQQPPAKPEPVRKIGEGVAQAALRQGFKELANITEAFPPGSPTVDEPGQIFNIPPQGVSQQTGFSQPVSYVDRHHQQAIGNIDPGREPNKEVAAAAPQPVTPAQPSIVDQHLADLQPPSVAEPPMEIEK